VFIWVLRSKEGTSLTFIIDKVIFSFTNALTMSTLKRCITLSSQVTKIDDAVSELIGFVVRLKSIENFTVSIALTEAMTNAIIHGNKKDSAKRVFAQALIESERVVFRIADEGIGFDYQKLADPTKKENLLKQSGWGIFFVRYFMDEVKFNYVLNMSNERKFLASV